MSLILRPHQIPVLEYAKQHPYFICSVDTGGGKTPLTLKMQDEAKCRLLVLCPSYLIPNWVDKIKMFFGDSKQVSVINHKDKVYELWDTDICLASYEWTAFYDILYSWADMIAYEEGHYLKNIEAARTFNSHKMLYENNIDRMMVLTGTPIKSKVFEFWSLIALCNYNPRIKNSKFLEKFPDTIKFAEHFSHRHEYVANIYSNKYKKIIPQTIVKYTGIKNIDELKGWLRGIYKRVNREEFMKTEKPEFVPVMVSYKDEPELQEEFDKYVETGSCSAVAKQKSALAKVPFTIKYVEDLLENVENAVVFTDYIDVCEAIANHFKVTPIHSQSVSKERRYELTVEFQQRKTRLIVATIGSMSTGYDLFAAKDMVFNDICWIPGDLKQAIARIDRDGQLYRCMIHLITGSYQDQKISSNMEKAQAVIDSIINGGGD